MNFLFEISKKKNNISELAKKGELTLPVASTLISRWAKDNVVIKTGADGQRGKEIIITLTEYGEAQVKLLKEINKNYKKNKKMNQEEKNAISLVTKQNGGKNGTEKD